MIVYMVSWDIASYDGERALSIWSTIEGAEGECKRLGKDVTFGSDTSITVVQVDKQDGVEEALLI